MNKLVQKNPYLQKYLSGDEAKKDKKKKKKKKEKHGVGVLGSAVLLVDDSVIASEAKRRRANEDDEDDVIDAHAPQQPSEEEEDDAAGAMIVGTEELGEQAAIEAMLANARKKSKIVQESRDSSPPRRARADSPDASPPRRGRSPDASPPRKGRSDSPDASPPRKRHDSPDASPPRRRHDSPDASPPRKRHDSPDASPPRRRHDSPDASPPRKGKEPSPVAGAAKGKSAKSQDGGDNEVLRDRKGRKLEMLNQMVNKDKDNDEPQYEWGRGLVKKDVVQEESGGGSFTVSVNDKVRDQRLKNQDRWGDPMAGLLEGKDGGDAKKKKKKDKMFELEYSGPGVKPNRFGIKPGAQWDGIDRSNRWEEKVFARMNAGRVRQQERDAWEVADL